MIGKIYIKIFDHEIEVSERTTRCYLELNKLLNHSNEDLLRLDPKARDEQHLTENLYSCIYKDLEQYMENSSLADEERDLLIEHLSGPELIDQLREQLDGQSR
jgi:hypothetical protein